MASLSKDPSLEKGNATELEDVSLPVKGGVPGTPEDVEIPNAKNKVRCGVHEITHSRAINDNSTITVDPQLLHDNAGA
jgi:hypothetical protein